MNTIAPPGASFDDPADGNVQAANTPPRRESDDIFSGDTALVEALHREGASAFAGECAQLGTRLGTEEAIRWGFAANENPPEHVPYDRSGVRADDIEFHPSFHDVMRTAVEAGVAGGAWADDRPGVHVARAAKFILVAQVEAGATCPLAMTYSSVPALRLEPSTRAAWEGLVTSGEYDARAVAPAQKRGALVGMALTEKTGGSDVRTSTTIAEPAGDGMYAVTGAKWFVSAVQSDAMFVLAQTATGLSCLLVPRRREDGSTNNWRIDRLKDKLGNRSNPTAEVEFRGSDATLIGEEGRGVRAIMEMIGGTRRDCVLGSTAVMRLGTAEAIHHTTHRFAFGRRLVQQPLMLSVLADLAVESEAATASAMWLSRQYEEAQNGSDRAQLLKRIAAPVLKYWVCKRAPQHAAEALECQGGYGYVEESRLPRMYREAPLMSIWEGSGNVQALDVLRAHGRSPESFEVLLDELGHATGANARLDAAVAGLKAELAGGELREGGARRMTGLMARTLQASLLVRHAPAAVSDAFCSSRLGDSGDAAFGTLAPGLDLQAIVDRHRPQAAA